MAKVKKSTFFISALILCLLPKLFSAQGTYETHRGSFIATGIEDLDHERRHILTHPTDKSNYLHRLNMLDQWTRMLCFAGADLSDYLSCKTALSGNLTCKEARRNTFKASEEELYQAIDSRFDCLEGIYSTFRNSPEGKDFDPRGDYPNNFREWPLFRGNPQNTGMTHDPGPTKGELAWRFPKGRPWYSRPAYEKGKVYAASPGSTTVLYCINEQDGHIEWRATQRGNGHQGGTARTLSSVVMLNDRCIIRRVKSSGNKNLVHVSKSDGRIIREASAGPIDFRVGSAPLDGNADTLILAYGERIVDRAIQQAENSTITTYDQVQCKDPEMETALWYPFDQLACMDPNTDAVLWNHKVGEYWTEPKLDGGNVFVATVYGDVICLNAAGDKERVAWTFNAKSPVHAGISVNADLVIAATEGGQIYAIQRENGEPVWCYQIEEPQTRAFQQFSSAEIGTDRLFIGGADGYLYCLDLKCGALKWRRNLGDWIRSKPLLMGDYVFSATLDGRLYKFDLQGKLIWVKQPSGHQIFADLVKGNGTILLNSSDLFVHCIDAEAGRERWRRSLMEAVYHQNERIWADFDGGGCDFQSSPVVAEGMVIAGGPDRFIHALDHETGKEIWRYEVRGKITAAPIYHKGKIYFGQVGGTAYYYCLNAATGTLAWKKAIGWVWSSANASDGKVYIPAVSGWVYCVDAGTGDILWGYSTKTSSFPAPALEGEVVVFGTRNNKFYGFNRHTGDVLWSVDIDGNPDSGAVMINAGKAYLQGLRADFFFCVDLETGKDIWKFPIPVGYECNMSPSVHHGKVFFSVFPCGEVCRSPVPGMTFCVNAETGEKIWELHGGGGLTGTASADGKVYFASNNDPFLWCVDENGNADGSTTVHWRFKMTGRAEEGCVTIAYGKAYIHTTDGFIYAVK